jgi:hypothetical protein
MAETHSEPRLGLPTTVIVALGLLAAPRVVLHDLGVVAEGTPVNAVLVFLPLLVWVAVAVRRSPKPFPSLLAVGGVHGLCLLVVHNLLWNRAWAGDPPRLGGNLTGRLPEALEEMVLRAAMSVSSFFTGLAVGTVCGVVAWAITRVRRGDAGRGGRPWPEARRR